MEKITLPENLEAVKKYQEQASHKTELERTGLIKDKTGVDTGAKVLHPITGEEIPGLDS